MAGGVSVRDVDVSSPYPWTAVYLWPAGAVRLRQAVGEEPWSGSCSWRLEADALLEMSRRKSSSMRTQSS